MGSQAFIPGYGGSIWIDPKNGRVLRIEMQAHGLPPEFPMDRVEEALDYQYVRLGSAEQFLLPVHSENLPASAERPSAARTLSTSGLSQVHRRIDIEFHEAK